MSWNGYPSHVRKSVIKRSKSNQKRNERNKEEDNRKIIWSRFPYLGKKGETLLTSLKRKMKRQFKRRCKIYHFLQYKENGNVLLGKRQN